jgi:hypothetical protein
MQAPKAPGGFGTRALDVQSEARSASVAPRVPVPQIGRLPEATVVPTVEEIREVAPGSVEPWLGVQSSGEAVSKTLVASLGPRPTTIAL